MTPEQAADAAALLTPARVIPSSFGATSGSPFASVPADPAADFRKAMERKGLGDRLSSWSRARAGTTRSPKVGLVLTSCESTAAPARFALAADGTLRFHRVSAPTDADITRLVAVIARRR